MDTLTSIGKSPEKQRVGKYILGEKLGEGGFGVVRKARNEETGEVVAIKILDKAQVQLMHMTPQIKREMMLLTMLKHPNIVKGYEILNSKSKLYFVMELVGGGDLHSFLTERRRLAEADAKRIFRGLIDCLVYCHGQGIYHRDLKLENILITPGGDAKVCDFGLTSVRSLNNNADSLCSTIVGTEDFAAPEIIQQLPYDPEKADMWSAGIILYTSIAGFCPFRGSDTQTLFANIKSCRFGFPEKFPQGAKDIVSRLLVPDPKKRPSAAEVHSFPWLSLTSQDEKTNESPRDVKPNEELASCPSEIADVDDSSRSAGSSSSTPAAPRASLLRNLEARNPALALAAQTIPDFEKIYDIMRDPALVKDRRWRLKLYPKTFVGSEMISWLTQRLSLSRQQVISIGQQMLQADVFHHVFREHDFEDDYLFYRFAEDEAEDSQVLNLQQLWLDRNAREPLTVSQTLLNSLLSLLKLHQSKASSGEPGEINLESLRSDAALLIFRMATAELQSVKLGDLLNPAASLAFLVNVYHLLVLHTHIQVGQAYSKGAPRPHTLKFQYNIAGHRIGRESLQSLLQSNPKGSWVSFLQRDSMSLIPRSVSFALSFVSKLAPETEKFMSQIKLDREDLRSIALILSSANQTDPPLRVYGAEDVTESSVLRLTARYLRRKIVVDVDRSRVGLPGIMREFRTRYSGPGNRAFISSVAALLEQNREIDGPDSACEKLHTLMSSELSPHIYFITDTMKFAPEIERS